MSLLSLGLGFLKGGLGWKGIAAAAAIGCAVGAWGGWELRDLIADRAERGRILEANRSLEEALYHKEREQIVNSAAIERMRAAEQAARDELEAFREKRRHADPNGDCLPVPDRQPWVDGLR